MRSPASAGSTAADESWSASPRTTRNSNPGEIKISRAPRMRRKTAVRRISARNAPASEPSSCPAATTRRPSRRALFSSSAVAAGKRIALRVKTNLFDALHAHRLERPQANMQRHVGNANAARANALQNLRREVQPGGRSRHRSALARIDRLVSLAICIRVSIFFRAPYVRRQRNMPKRVECRDRNPQPARSAAYARRTRREQPPRRAAHPRQRAVASPTCTLRPGRTSAFHSHSPAWLVRKTSMRPLGFSPRPQLPRAAQKAVPESPGCRSAPADRPRAADRENLEIRCPATARSGDRAPASALRRDPQAAAAQSILQEDRNRNRRQAL